MSDRVTNGNPAIVLEGVTKQSGTFTAVRDMNLRVEPGLVYGFLGPNGAGKTTTLRIILSIFEPTSGKVGDPRPQIGARGARPDQLPPEEKGLYKKMRAWAVIAYFGALKGMPRAEAKRKANELLERYGLGAFANHKCDALSKGLQQKVQLLAAIVHDPELVILDEPLLGARSREPGGDGGGDRRPQERGAR